VFLAILAGSRLLPERGHISRSSCFQFEHYFAGRASKIAVPRALLSRLPRMATSKSCDMPSTARKLTSDPRASESRNSRKRRK